MSYNFDFKAALYCEGKSVVFEYHSLKDSILHSTTTWSIVFHDLFKEIAKYLIGDCFSVIEHGENDEFTEKTWTHRSKGKKEQSDYTHHEHKHDDRYSDEEYSLLFADPEWFQPTLSSGEEFVISLMKGDKTNQITLKGFKKPEIYKIVEIINNEFNSEYGVNCFVAVGG